MCIVPRRHTHFSNFKGNFMENYKTSYTLWYDIRLLRSGT